MSDQPPPPPAAPPGGDDPFTGPSGFGQSAPPPWGSTMPGAPSSGPSVPPGTPPWGSTPLGPQAWTPETGKKHGLATAALVLGVIGLLTCFLVIPSLLALIFGLMSLSAIKKSEGALTGRGPALWGAVLGGVGLALFAVVVAIGVLAGDSSDTSTSDESPTPTVIDDGNTSVFQMDVGDCVTVPLDGTIVKSVDVVDCADDHDGEVFAEGSLDNDRAYPGESAVQDEVEAACADAFEGYVGRDYDSSELGIFYFSPRDKGWDLDSGYTCVATAPEGEMLTGSVADSGR